MPWFPINPSDPDQQDVCEEVEAFAKVHYPQAGIIIVQIREGKEAEYFHEHQSFHQFDDPNHAEEPVTYSTIKGALKRLAKIPEEIRFSKAKYCLAFWVHPDATSVPLAKYEAMTGGKFPGSPRR
jgi:hypothetical protein